MKPTETAATKVSKLESPAWVIGGSAAILTLMGLIRIGHSSISFDESASLFISREWTAMWETLLHHETNMWLYYILLNFWQAIGRSEFVVRFLSVIFAVATVPVVWGSGRILFDRRRAAVATILFSVNILVIQYAQNARGYTLLLFLVSLSSYLFVRAIEERSVGLWLWYAVASALAVYAHLFGFLALGAQVISLVVLGRHDIPWKHMLTGAAFFLLLLVPMIVFQSLFTGQADWIQRPSLHDVYTAVRSLAGTSPVFIAVYVPLAMVSIIGIWRSVQGQQDRARWKNVYPVFLLVAPFAVIVPFSYALKPMLVPRYMIFCVVPFVLLVADGWSRVPQRGWQTLFAAVLIGTTAMGMVKYYSRESHEDWRSVASFVSQHGADGDAVVFYAYFVQIPFAYYFDRPGIHRAPIELVDLASAPWRGHPGKLSDLPDPDYGRIARLHDHHKRLWAVLGYDVPEELGRKTESAEIQHALGESYHLLHSWEFDEITLKLFETPDTASADSSGNEKPFDY
jgi:mannosyltransferase